MYKIFRCNFCRMFNMSSAKKNFKCMKCYKNIDVSKRKIYFLDENPQVVSKVLIELKAEDFKSNELNDGLDDFHSYEIKK